MVILDNMKDGILSLKINKIRLVLPILSIMVGVSSLVLISSVIEGEKRFIATEIEKLGAKLISVFMKEMERGFTSRDIRGLVKLCPEIKQIIPLSTTSFPIYAFNTSIDNVQITGVPAELKDITNIPLRMGRFFTNEEVSNFTNVCVIGEKVYNKLFKVNQHPIGQSLYIVKDANQKVNLRIIGVLYKTNQQIYELVGDGGIFIPITVLQKKIIGKEEYSSLLVETKTKEGVSMVVKQIKKLFGLKKIPAFVYAPKELLSASRLIDKKVTIFGYAIGILLLIVGGIGIMNIMLKQVLERTKEIGIRKAVGAKNRDILIQFLTEAVIMGILGCIGGIITGILGAHIVASSVIKSGAIPVISIMIISISSSVAMVIIILFGFYPSFRAAALNPIDALRYE